MNWKRKFQLDTWDLLMSKIYEDGLNFKSVNLRAVIASTGLTKPFFYGALRNGHQKFNPDCDTMHVILSKYDTVKDAQLMYHPKNVWAKKLLGRLGGELMSSLAGIDEG
jgi:hypothetical protein